MNKKYKNNRGDIFISNALYTILSNSVTLFVSVLITLIIPKLLGQEEYAKWQLYIFYSSFASLFHLGWPDGLYLQYSGKIKKYRKEVNQQFSLFVIFEVFLTLLMILFASIHLENYYRIIGISVLLSALIVNIKTIVDFIYQANNKFKNTSVSIIIMNTVNVFFLMIMFSLYKSYIIMIACDIIAKVVGLVYIYSKSKRLQFEKISNFKIQLIQGLDLIKSGLNIVFAYLTSNLIIGVIRITISRVWGLLVFGKISFSLSLINFFMVFINGMSNVMFQNLRNNNEIATSYYLTIRKKLMFVVLGLLLLYGPVFYILNLWLPQYYESLVYLNILLPMLVFEGKYGLLILPYMKHFRLENALFKNNLFALSISLISSITFGYFFPNLNILVFTIFLSISFRSIVGEIKLSDYLGVNVRNLLIIEFLLSIAFIIVFYQVSMIMATLTYFILYLLYVYFLILKG